MVWLPVVEKRVEKVAVPFAPTVAVPRITLPSLKVTAAVGVPVKVAWPLALTGALPATAPSRKKVTKPVGAPPDEVTVAVSVTGWPKTDELHEALRTAAVAVGEA